MEILQCKRKWKKEEEAKRAQRGVVETELKQEGTDGHSLDGKRSGVKVPKSYHQHSFSSSR